MKTSLLRDVATIERCGVDPTQVDPTTCYIGLEHIERGGRITGDETVASASVRSTKFQFTAKHLLFGKLRPNLGKIARPAGPGVCSTDILPILPGSMLDRGFLFHYLSQTKVVAFAASQATGANLPRLSPTALGKFDIPLPPLAEQRRIAAILDHADALGGKSRDAIYQINRLATSIFLHMFGDPVRNDMNWPAGLLGDYAERVTDGEHKTPCRTESGVPLLSARSVQSGWIDFQATDFVSNAEYEKLSRRIEPRVGDVLISCSGTIGRVALVRDLARFAMVRSVALVRPRPDLSSGFLEQLLSTPSLNALMNMRANSSAQANLFQNQIRKLPVIVPPVSLQEEFESRIEAVAQQRLLTTSAAVKLDELFASLQTRAFSGQL